MDKSELANYVLRALPGIQEVTVKLIRQEMGESYTGGRSTPIYKLVVEVTPDGTGGTAEGIEPREIKLVAKRICLRHKEGLRLERTNYDALAFAAKVRSYLMEAGFYGHAAEGNQFVAYPAKACRRAGLQIPEVYSVECDGAYTNSSIKSEASICFLMNDLTLSHPIHPQFLSFHQARIALDWIAKFHARFWAAPKAQNEWPGSVVWEEGGFWPLDHCFSRATSKVFVDVIAQQWTKTMQWLKRKHSMGNEEYTLLAQRMATCHGAIQKLLHESNLDDLPRLSPIFYEKREPRTTYRPERPHATLVHGDFKAANMFFTSDSNGHNDEDLNLHCAVCDFQFVGPGVGATDIAYLLFPDPRVSYYDDETELLDWYHQRLQHHLKSMGKQEDGESYYRQVLSFHYKCAQIEIFCHLLGRGWVASSENDLLLIQSSHAFMSSLDNGELLDCENYQHCLTKACSELC